MAKNKENGTSFSADVLAKDLFERYMDLANDPNGDHKRLDSLSNSAGKILKIYSEQLKYQSTPNMKSKIEFFEV